MIGLTSIAPMLDTPSPGSREGKTTLALLEALGSSLDIRVVLARAYPLLLESRSRRLRGAGHLVDGAPRGLRVDGGAAPARLLRRLPRDGGPRLRAQGGRWAAQRGAPRRGDGLPRRAGGQHDVPPRARGGRADRAGDGGDAPRRRALAERALDLPRAAAAVHRARARRLAARDAGPRQRRAELSPLRCRRRLGCRDGGAAARPRRGHRVGRAAGSRSRAHGRGDPAPRALVCPP